MAALSGTNLTLTYSVSTASIIAVLQGNLDEAALEEVQQRLLGGLAERSGVRGVVIDVSGVTLLDADEFVRLRQIMSMVDLMGSRCMAIGLRPGIAAALAQLDVPTAGFSAAISLDAAHEAMGPAWTMSSS
jgi:rsbT antagonist protein RsbS